MSTINFSFDASILQQQRYTGCQIYTHNILKQLALISPDNVTLHFYFTMDGWNERIEELTNLPHVEVHRTQGKLNRWFGLALSTRKVGSRAHYIMNGIDGTLRVPLACPTLVLLHDLRDVLYPQIVGEAHSTAYIRRTKGWIHRCNRIVTGAESVKREIEEQFQIPPDRIFIAAEATDHLVTSLVPTRPAALESGYPFLLMFNIGDPFKNWNYAFQAFARYLDAHPEDQETHLVIAGSLRWQADTIKQDLKSLPQVEARTVFAGYVSDEELLYLYQNALCLLFPSLYEGFGIPTLEAMGQGLPVLLTDIPVFHEVAQDKALFSPLEQPEEMAQNIHRVVSDANLRSRLSIDGKVRASEFSWKRSAQKTLDLLMSLASPPC